jgi:hypothetical protein
MRPLQYFAVFFNKNTLFCNTKTMKKLAAIFLLALFAFNMIGYQLLYKYMAGHSDVRLEAKLDNRSYADADLILIKQAHNLPYFTDSKEFQRIDGEVNIDGVLYKYVKYRIYNGFVEMLCIPHHQKMQLAQQQNKMAATDSEYATTAEKKTEKTAKKQQTPAWDCDEICTLFTVSRTFKAINHSGQEPNNWHNANLFTPKQPPELA